MGNNSNLLCIHRDPPQLRLLRDQGYELTTATSGSEALEVCISRPVDAVVLEHDLSFVDGASVADTIKQVRPDMPIILIAEHTELPASALKSIDALVAKSDGPHFLWATVHFILNVKPRQRRQLKSAAARVRSAKRSSPELKEVPFSQREWRNIKNGIIKF
jgi:CheY-like chemotaxis protein